MNGFNLSDIQDAKLGGTQLSAIYLGSSKLWPSIDYSQEYLTITSLADSNDITWVANSSSYTRTIEWSVDKITWTSITSATSSNTITTLNTGEKLYLRGTNTTYCSSGTNYTAIRSVDNKQFNVSGNILSLIYGDNFMNYTAFSSGERHVSQLFRNSNVVNASNLILPKTSTRSFQSLFMNCSDLIYPPTVTDTNIAAYAAINAMFYGCTALVDASNVMPNVTTLSSECCGQMFYGCTSMVKGPTQINANIPQGACNQMFKGCTSLIKAPDLLGTSVASYGCNQMFDGCTSLNYVKCMATSKSGSSNFTSWLNGVASSGTFVKDANSTLFPSGTSGIPSNWTVINI